MNKKIVIAVGGTGGHLYPAQALAEQLIELGHNVLFVGGELDNNRFFNDEKYLFRSVTCNSLASKNPLKLMKGFGKLFQGVLQSRKIYREFRPEMVVGFGSYHTLPVILAAKLNSVPIVLHEANAAPGRVNRWFSPYVAATGVHFKNTPLKGNVEHVGLPLRKKIGTKEEALEYFKLAGNKKTLLVFGGSQGALALNHLASVAICQVKQPLQVLHFTGEDKGKEEIIERYRGITSVVKMFEPRMDLAWELADFAITRSGASSLAEQVAYNVPGILVPYPYAMDNHQEKNADCVIEETGGCVKLLQKDLTPDILAGVIDNFSLTMNTLKHEHLQLVDLVEKELK